MKSHQLARLMAGVCAAAATFSSASARADDAGRGHWAFAVGADYTRGTYGEAVDTTIYQVPFSVGYTSDRFSLSVSAPYVHLKGSGDIIPGSVSAFGPGSTGSTSASASAGGVSSNLGPGGFGLSPGGGLVNALLPSPPAVSPTPSGPPSRSTVAEHEGIGDATLSASYALFVSQSGARFTISRRISASHRRRQESAGRWPNYRLGLRKLRLPHQRACGALYGCRLSGRVRHQYVRRLCGRRRRNPRRRYRRSRRQRLVGARRDQSRAEPVASHALWRRRSLGVQLVFN